MDSYSGSKGIVGKSYSQFLSGLLTWQDCSSPTADISPNWEAVKPSDLNPHSVPPWWCEHRQVTGLFHALITSSIEEG